MLQQTQVTTVVAYYQRFIKRFPTIKKLASAEEAEVLKLWEGLGYYRRARQLHSAAKTVVEKHAGKFPTQFEDVLALPGIGRYTAGAILSISLDQSHPILEGNTIRLFARLMLMEDDTTTRDNQNALWAFSESLVPRKRAGDFNQALMELGSEICKPRNPLCTDCPIRIHCPTQAEHRQREIPRPKKPPRYEDINEAVVVLQKKSKVLMRVCQPGERWAGLWDFPRWEISSANPELQLANELKEMTGLSAVLLDTKQPIKHAVTRFRITLECFHAEQIKGRLKSATAFQWVEKEQLAQLPLSVTGRKVAKRLKMESRR